jgi:hypothetical protein
VVLHSIFKDFAGPVATVIAAAAAAYFANRQWRTAQENTLLNLFDRRFAVYEEIRAVVTRYKQHGIDEDAYARFLTGASRAQFLFGPEITKFLEAIKEDLAREMAASTIDPRTRAPPEKFETVSAEWVERRERLGAFPKEFDRKVSSYLKHHQKGAGTS